MTILEFQVSLGYSKVKFMTILEFQASLGYSKASL